MSLKLEDAMGNQVKEKLDCWRDGDDRRVLVQMLVKSIEISNNYSFTTAKEIGRPWPKQSAVPSLADAKGNSMPWSKE